MNWIDFGVYCGQNTFFDQNCILVQKICVDIASVFTATVTVDLLIGAIEYFLITSMSVSLVSFSRVNYHLKRFVFTYGAPGFRTVQMGNSCEIEAVEVRLWLPACLIFSLLF